MPSGPGSAERLSSEDASELRLVGWRKSLVRPREDPDIFKEALEGPPTFVVRLYEGLGFLNLCLLGPMLTVIAAEIIVGQKVHLLLQDQTVMLGFCASFALEWLVGLLLTRSRTAYAKNVWLGLDLLSSVPFGFLFQAGRLARLGRVGRFFRFAGYARAAKVLRLQRLRLDAKRIVRAIAILFSVAASGAIAIRSIEPMTATSFGDAFWWSLVTVCTVGYGDIVPTSPAGRIVGIVLIVIGIGVYGFVAGLAADALSAPEDAREHQDTLDALVRLEAKIDALASLTSGPGLETDAQNERP